MSRRPVRLVAAALVLCSAAACAPAPAPDASDDGSAPGPKPAPGTGPLIPRQSDQADMPRLLKHIATVTRQQKGITSNLTLIDKKARTYEVEEGVDLRNRKRIKANVSVRQKPSESATSVLVDGHDTFVRDEKKDTLVLRPAERIPPGVVAPVRDLVDPAAMLDPANFPGCDMFYLGAGWYSEGGSVHYFAIVPTGTHWKNGSFPEPLQQVEIDDDHRLIGVKNLRVKGIMVTHASFGSFDREVDVSAPLH